ncbi:MAG: hypothetical protein KIS66_16415 [Fimbriimonadaceae bacterium]|nr:hypothetical protein [Fimbriimonadaceae bacterium]
MSALLALMMCASLGQPTTYDLSPKLKVGDELRFTAKAEMTFAGEKATLTTRLKVKAAEVGEDGSLTLETTQAEGKATMGGRTSNLPPQKPSRTRYGRGGAVEGLQGENADAIGYRQANLNAFRAPEKPVTIGERWTTAIAEDKRTGQVKAEATFELLALENIRSQECAKVKATYRELEGAAPAGSEAILWISLKDGWTMREERTIRNAPLGSSPTPVDVTRTVERE